MININTVLYSYKGPHLVEVCKALIESTELVLHISVLDQHPLDRESKLRELYNIDYQHQFWDKIDGPTWFKEETIFDEKLDAEYTLVISDDVVVTPGWLESCIEFLNNNKKVLISGQGRKKAFNKDKYFLEAKDMGETDLFSLTNLIDRNFIFGYTETFRMTGYPRDIKYYGEEEALAIRCIDKGISIYSAPNNLYKDLKSRTIESLYCPFSKEHNYNNVVRLMNSEAGVEWLKKINIEVAPIELVYQNNDVEYDPYKLKFTDLGGERFIGNTHAIY